jgi:tRNA(adenine34) deaminase
VDEQLMHRAIALARQGLAEGEMPIGALVAVDGDVVAEAYWRGEREGALLRHPELVALLDAEHAAAGRRQQAALYTTLEPCLMCMGAAMSFFVGRVVYALRSPTDGASRVAGTWAPAAGHPTAGAYRIPEITRGVCAEEARALVQEYLAGGAQGPQVRFAATLVR